MAAIRQHLVSKANELEGKIQGISWGIEKLCEYEHYDAAKEQKKMRDKAYDELNSLGLTPEERALVKADMKVAEDWYWRSRC